MEQNQELSAQRSLELINETLDGTRKAIVRKNGVSFILWGCLLTIMSLLVYILWKTTGSPSWNFLWFVMPLIGFPLSMIIKKKESIPVPVNMISRLLGGIWTSFCFFSLAVAALSVIFALPGASAEASNSVAVTKMFAMANLTPSILLLFGISETFSGVVLKNKAIAVGGFIIGVGGLAVYYISGLPIEQMLIFTLAGVVLALTGVIVKLQNR